MTRRRIVFLADAHRDVRLATAWHELRFAGSGGKFLSALDRLLQRISRFPEVHPVLRQQVGTATMRPFHYSLVFETRDDGELLIVALLHRSRHQEHTSDQLSPG